MVKPVFQASDGSVHETKKEAQRRDFEIEVGHAAIAACNDDDKVSPALVGAALCEAFNIRQKAPPAATGG